MTINERFKQVLNIKGLSVKEASSITGMSEGYIRKLCTTGSSFGTDPLISLLNSITDLNARWLLTGEGNPLKGDERSTFIGIEDNGEGIPLYRTEAAAGFGSANFAIEEKDIEARYKIRELNNASFMHYVRGDSMIPTYQNGDIVAVKIIYDYMNIQWGKPHLVSSTEHGLLVKRIYNENDGGIIAVSDNPTYRPIHIRKNDIKGIGIIIGCVKFESY